MLNILSFLCLCGLKCHVHVYTNAHVYTCIYNYMYIILEVFNFEFVAELGSKPPLYTRSFIHMYSYIHVHVYTCIASSANNMMLNGR